MTIKNNETKSEKTERKINSETKDELRDGLLKRLSEKFEEMNLGTPDEEIMKNFNELLSILPEGKIKEMMGSLESTVALSGKIGGFKGKAQDVLWKFLKPMLVLEAPWIAAIPGDINSKFQSGLIRVIGRVETGGLKGLISIGEKLRKMKEKGKSGEEMAEMVIEEGNPEKAIGEILD
jgi:hypothetical protein